MVLSIVCGYAVVTCLCPPLNDKIFRGGDEAVFLPFLWPQLLHTLRSSNTGHSVVDYFLCLGHLCVCETAPVSNAHNNLNFYGTLTAFTN